MKDIRCGLHCYGEDPRSKLKGKFELDSEGVMGIDGEYSPMACKLSTFTKAMGVYCLVSIPSLSTNPLWSYSLV